MALEKECSRPKWNVFIVYLMMNHAEYTRECSTRAWAFCRHDVFLMAWMFT